MTTLIYNNQKLKLQLTATNTNLSIVLTQLYGSVLKYLELDERKAERAYYDSMVAAYSQEDNESRDMAEAFMSLSEEADNLSIKIKSSYYD